MSEVVHETQNDFWRPPVVAQAAPIIVPAVSPALVDACDRCEAEFMVGARYCYMCGAVRPQQFHVAQSWTSYLEFNYINQAIGLRVASLVAFLAGLGCLLAAAFVGIFSTIQNFNDFQAVQFWRMQWLLAAIAFFVAGLLLKRSGTQPKVPSH
jgi:hypothetical protein